MGLLFYVHGITVSAERKAEDNPVIAYVSSSTDNQEIRLINPDGTDDRLLWRIPAESNPRDGIGSLSWHPSATELAFDSGHDWQRSMNIRDLYSTSVSGDSLHRITRPPSPMGYSQYPTGTVTFVLNAWEQGDVQIYIEGATQQIEYFARSNTDYIITQAVADFGPDIRQYIRLWDPDAVKHTCNYVEEGWVDVTAGTVTDLGTLDFAQVTADYTCPILFRPSWSNDGNDLLYIYREPTWSSDPENNIWQVSIEAETGTIGERILDMGNYPLRGRIYRVVSAPTAQRAGEMLFLEDQTLSDRIFYATTTNPQEHRDIDLGLCLWLTCDILDIAWLSDGSGFIFSRYEDAGSFPNPSLPPSGGIIYHYNFARGQYSEILRLPGEAIGNISISPDDATIVFERSPRLEPDIVLKYMFGPSVQCPCELWMVESDGTDLQLLAADGRAPVWSPAALPSTIPPAATPAPTSNPTATPTSTPLSTPSPTSVTPILAMVGNATIAPGAYVTLKGTNFPPNEEVTLLVNSIVIGTITVGTNGEFSVALVTTEAANSATYRVSAATYPSSVASFAVDTTAAPMDQPPLPSTFRSLPVDIQSVFLPVITR